jgi:hypothetical protein
MQLGECVQAKSEFITSDQSKSFGKIQYSHPETEAPKNSRTPDSHRVNQPHSKDRVLFR